MTTEPSEEQNEVNHHEEGGQELAEGGEGEAQAAAAMADPVQLGEPEPEQQEEEERTLTDHLNKRLLESFLQHLDAGSVPLPQQQQGDPQEGDGEEEQEFEDS